MLHAKTSVVDGQWARVGSTNLNLQSWMGNYELDVAVEDAGFARELEAIYLEDLTNATEIVLSKRSRVQPIIHPAGHRRWHRLRSGTSSRAATSAVRWVNTVGAAIANRRELGPAESRLMGSMGVLLGVIAALAIIWPRVVAVPVALLALWLAIGSIARAWHLRRTKGQTAPPPAPSRGATEPAAERLP